jgi:tetratricopeptide (TPR) repeat protein
MPAPVPRWRRAVQAAGLGAGLLIGAWLAGCSSTPERVPSATQLQARNTSERAARALQRGDLDQARVLYGAALDAAQALQDPALTGAALLNLTLVDARRGDLAAAQAHVDSMLANPARYEPALLARAAARKALLMLDAGQPDAALAWAGEARKFCGAPCALGPMLDNLAAHVALGQGDAAGALALARRAAEQAGTGEQVGEQSSALRLAGRAASQLGDTPAAADWLARALQLDRDLGQPDRVALDLLFAAENEDRRGNTAAATDLYQRALTVYNAIGDKPNAAVVRARLGSR